MNRLKQLQFTLLILMLLPIVLIFPISSTQAKTSASESEAPASRITWDSYYLGDISEGLLPTRWHPFSTMDADPQGVSSNRELWLKATIPNNEHSPGQLLVYSYIVEDFEISLYADGKPIYRSEKLLPSGFISWRMIAYDSKVGAKDQVLVARISPRQNLEGFEVWTGAAPAIALKLLRTEAPVWAGAIVLALLSAISLLLFLFNRSQKLFIYFAVFFASIAIDLTVLWGGWQYAFRPESLMILGSLVHFNWYIGYASGILITYAIVGERGSTWIRNLGYAVVVYAFTAIAGWQILGEQAQLLFYQLFYDYISACLLLVLAVVLIRALRRRRNTEITVFAIGNALLVGGLVLGQSVSGQFGLLPTPRTMLTSHHAFAQIGWTFVGFGGAILCLGIIMGMRIMRMAQLRSTNKELGKLNDELRIANDKLARIDDIRSNMYSEVSHELNTPITAIKGYVQLMLNGTIPAGETRYLQVIHDKSLVMERMIDDMLEIARLENKNTQFDFELVPFTDLFARLCSKVQLDMLERGFAFTWSPIPEPDWPDRFSAIYADPMRVEQVFVNLLSNARKFTPVGGAIRIEAVIERQSLTIRFVDSGCGIEASEREHIFERYYRGQAAKTGTVMGTGLGLPICREIMNAHNGEIGLERSSAQGSTFYIRFPLRYAQMREMEPEETA
ncbi:sensor histidine kinase [Cohnella herbarum]|uniref:histidine kinase n=1 Tax=Cohnella herbarum TaxID=2728023 RepID=A0A7Z2VKZ2_9BACL|nr:HAMP domain-containing sensor histidine kinase [Cohnella herbarum]QJD84992.1 HAMP domain-containing histidine kinase [Cohnella herbarum]